MATGVGTARGCYPQGSESALLVGITHSVPEWPFSRAVLLEAINEGCLQWLVQPGVLSPGVGCTAWHVLAGPHSHEWVRWGKQYLSVMNWLSGAGERNTASPSVESNAVAVTACHTHNDLLLNSLSHMQRFVTHHLVTHTQRFVTHQLGTQ